MPMRIDWPVSGSMLSSSSPAVFLSSPRLDSIRVMARASVARLDSRIPLAYSSTDKAGRRVLWLEGSGGIGVAERLVCTGREDRRGAGFMECIEILWWDNAAYGNQDIAST